MKHPDCVDMGLKVSDRVCSLAPILSENATVDGFMETEQNQVGKKRNMLITGITIATGKNHYENCWSVLCSPIIEAHQRTKFRKLQASKSARVEVQEKIDILKHLIFSSRASFRFGKDEVSCGGAMEFAVAKAEAYCEYAEAAIKSCTDTDFVAIKTQMISRIETLHRELQQDCLSPNTPTRPDECNERQTNPPARPPFKATKPRLLPSSFVQHGQSLARLLEQGWKVHYHRTYAHATQLSDLDPGHGEWLLVGAKRKGEDELLLAASGKREQVLHRTTGRHETHESNGVHWYLRDAHCFGFAGATGIDLGEEETGCDSMETAENKRLSWFLDGHG
eukprot:CAMPEP_0181291756 /NCGR_PEP_ID=MMETSP1101-20121128/2140_1 /TAXON_ID=46948 /ORGANISM="Rhodomonas abbreviata, Strain Caron Lab Isolate" /LENGTH=335 /DNA_ID=CAMNT_0023396175 /DNA_START=112 /DNA_END=1115 /DNA_ORIENTATION=-